MMTDSQKAQTRRFAGVVRLVVSAICMVWLGYLLIEAPWSRGGQFLLGFLSVGIIPLILIVALLPDGLRQTFGQPKA